MRKITYIIALISIVALLLAGCSQPTEQPAAEETQAPANGSKLPDLGGKTVIVAVENAYPPFNQIDEKTNEGVGWDYDSVREICKRINCVPEFKQAAWDGIFPAMQAGEYDWLADGVTIKPEREEIVDFSIPYAKVSQILLVRSDETASLDDFKNDDKKLIGTQISTTNEIVAQDYFGTERVNSFEDFGAAILLFYLEMLMVSLSITSLERVIWKKMMES